MAVPSDRFCDEYSQRRSSKLICSALASGNSRLLRDTVGRSIVNRRIRASFDWQRRETGRVRMVDIGRITSRKGAIAVLIVLCVSAVLFIAPWILSVFYDSDPYEDWDGKDIQFRSQESEGNLTLLCTSGPCVACTAGEKADPKFKCSPTGYHKAQECVEDKVAAGEEVQPNVSRDGATKDPVLGKDESQGDGGDKEKAADGGVNARRRRRLAAAAGGAKLVYKTCIPQDVKEKLSVFGFEGVVLVCLLLSAPAVHYRKKRGAASQGLQRIPSTARF